MELRDYYKHFRFMFVQNTQFTFKIILKNSSIVKTIASYKKLEKKLTYYFEIPTLLF